jgi:hypothetical protein
VNRRFRGWVYSVLLNLIQRLSTTLPVIDTSSYRHEHADECAAIGTLMGRS